MGDKLVPRRSELATLGGVLLTPSQRALVRQIEVTAQNAKTELSDAVAEEWKREFERQCRSD
jgi:hypothetical protein